MKSETVIDTLVPPRLIPEITAAADEDQREAGDLVGEALEIYLKRKPCSGCGRRSRIGSHRAAVAGPMEAASRRMRSTAQSA